MAWYVVHVGRKTGVFSTWDACHDQVIGFKGACYKKYKTREEVGLHSMVHKLKQKSTLKNKA